MALSFCLLHITQCQGHNNSLRDRPWLGCGLSTYTQCRGDWFLFETIGVLVCIVCVDRCQTHGHTHMHPLGQKLCLKESTQE